MSEADPPKKSVGYRRPPAEHQFKKGVSGNPRGRPRRTQQSPKTCSSGFGTQPANALLMEEAYRQITIREVDKVIQLPAIQAVFRAMGVSAMKGSRFAQQMMADLVRNVEEEDRQLRMQLFETMIGYKCDWERSIDAAIQRGIAPPEPLPHPDDIIVDLPNSRAVICGPSTKEEKEQWDRTLEYLDEVQGDASMYASVYRKSRNTEKKAQALYYWKFYQKFFNRLNDNLPKRYRQR